MSLVNRFSEEIGLLYDDSFKEFVSASLDKVHLQQYAEEDIELTKRVVNIANTIITVMDSSDAEHDGVLAAAILHGICRYDLSTGEREPDAMHQFYPRSYLAEFESILGGSGRAIFNNIMLLIEGQKGIRSPIPHVMPSVEDPVFLWVLPISIALAEKGDN